MNRSPWTIVRLEPGDPDVAGLLDRADPSHRDLDAWVLDADVVHGAVYDSSLVGLAARLRTALHPARAWLTVHVDPASRRRGVGAALFEEATADGSSTKIRIPSGNESGIRFARSRGYSPLITSSDVLIRELPKAPTPPGIDVAPASTDDDELLEALGLLYVASHRWDPATGADHREIGRYLTDDDVIAGTAHIVRRDDRVVGAGLAYSSRSSGVVEMANFGAIDPEGADAMDVTHVVLDAVGRALLDDGLAISIECDFGPGANTALQDLMRRLGAQPLTTVEILCR